MNPLQSIGGAETAIIGLLLFTFVALLGLFGYLLYRLLTEPPDEIQDESGALSQSMRQTVDIVVAVSLILVGIAGAALGGFLLSLADRETIRELIEEETIESDVLSADTLVDLLYNGLLWGGWGVILAGIAIVIAGVGFAVHRRRLDRRLAAGEEVVPSMASNALLGAVVTIVTSFIPFSSVLGGFVAGYLQQDGTSGGVRAGVLTGVFLSIPGAIIVGTVGVGLILEGLVTLTLAVVFGLVVSVLISIALTAGGGYFGGYIVTSRANKRDEPSPEYQAWRDQRENERLDEGSRPDERGESAERERP